MKYLYTTTPDEGCHKINGVYGRPVHTHEQPTLKAKGWKENPDDLREEEGREEAEEVIEEATDEMAKLYEEVIGKKPHHKMKFETMKAKVDEALNNV